jgi:hypothetical protein
MVAATCPHCGYDLSETLDQSARSAKPASIAWIAPTAGSLVASLCIVAGIFLSVYALAFGEIIKGLSWVFLTVFIAILATRRS